jgi:ABC-type branched-subunit amino acid transport system substrate-binding protein
MRQQVTWKRRDYLRVAGAAGAAGLTATAGCLGGVLGGSGPVPIAVMLPESGPMSEYTTGIRTGIDLAVSDANEAGAPMDRGLEIHTADTAGDPSTAESEAERLVSEESVAAFVGCLSFPVAQALEGIATNEEVYGISPTITAPELSSTARKGQVKFFGRTARSRGHIGKAMGEVMNDQGADEGVFAHPDDDQSEEVATMGEDVHGGVANTVAYPTDESGYDEAVSEIMGYEPTEIGVVGTPEQALGLVDAVREEGYSGVWVFDEHLHDGDAAAELGGLSDAFAVAPNPLSSPGAGNLEGRFDGETNRYTTYAYDAMALVALAMHQGGEAQGYESALNIADVAATTQGENVTEVEVTAGADGMAEAKSAIDDRNAVNYQGASGLVDLSIDHNPLDRMGIYELADGSYSHVNDIPGEEFERSTGGQATG